MLKKCKIMQKIHKSMTKFDKKIIDQHISTEFLDCLFLESGYKNAHMWGDNLVTL